MVRTLFWTNNSRIFQGLSRTHFQLFKDFMWRLVDVRWAVIIVFICFLLFWVTIFLLPVTFSFELGTWESGLDEVSNKFRGPSSTDNSRPWILFWNYRTFKARANPVISSCILVCFIWKTVAQPVWSLEVIINGNTKNKKNRLNYRDLCLQLSQQVCTASLNLPLLRKLS